jgi:AraC-like DNA-binding protein
MSISRKKYSVQFLVTKLEEHGLSRTEILRIPVLEGISPNESNIFMTLRDYLSFFNEAAVKCQDECLGLHVGTDTELDDFGYVGLLVNHSATLRDSWLTFERYLSIIFPEMVLRFEEGEQTSRIDYDVISYSTEDARQDVDMSLASLVRFFRAYAGENWSPEEVSVKHAEPGNSEEYARFYGTGVKFHQPTSSLIFASSVLDLRVSNTDPELLGVMREHADELLANISLRDNVVTNVRYHIVSSIGTEMCTSEIIARNLFISQRTLKRRLADLDTSFRQLKLGVMEDLAKRALTETSSSVSQIALKLGYSESAAFNHAFKNATGLTPTDYQKIAENRA